MPSKTQNAIALLLALLNFIAISTVVTLTMRAEPTDGTITAPVSIVG